MGKCAVVDQAEILGVKRSSNKKAYYAQTRSGRSAQLRSVTSVLNIISKDEALMRWAINLYSKCLRESAPVGHVLTGDSLEAMIERGSNEFERVRYDAAEVGTRAHNLIHDWLLSRPLPSLEDEDPRVANALRLFWAWWEDKGVQVVDSEAQVYHGAHGYAGTLDFLCELPCGRLALLDWKTSKGVWPEMYLQCAAYYYALDAMARAGQPGGRLASEIAEVTILRIGKEDAHFEPVSIPLDVLPRAYRAFYCCLQIQDMLSEINSLERARWKAYQDHLRAIESPSPSPF